MVQETKQDSAIAFDNVGMIIDPYFPGCPSNNWRTSIRYYTTIFSNQNKRSIENVIRNIILNTICSIIGIFSCFS